MTHVRLGLPVLALALAVAAPLAAQERLRSPEAEKVLKALIGLPHTKHLDTLKALGITPGTGLFDCVCRSAGYGSSTTAQFYHPDTIGEYNKTYSCSQPGEPCVVSGFGCTRHPMPADPAIWEACAREHLDEAGVNPLDKLLQEINKHGAKPARDYLADLDQCRANWNSALIDNPGLTTVAGLTYFGNNGAKLLPPPPKVSETLKQQVNSDAKRLADKVRDATAKVAKDWKQLAAEKAYEQVVQNPDTYKAAAAMAAEVIGLEMRQLDVASSDRAAAWKALTATGISGDELNFKFQIYRADMARIAQRKKELARDLTDLTVIAGVAEGYKDATGLKKAIEGMTSDDTRKQLKGFADSTKTLKKYLDSFAGWSTKDLKGLAEKVRSKGLSDKEFARLQDLTTQSAALKGLSTALDASAKVTNRAIQGYDVFRSYMDGLEKAAEYGRSGNYTEAQRNLLGAFKTLEKLAGLGKTYLPPGISDLMTYYEEAMKTPAKFDAFVRDVVNRGDVAAEIVGDQNQLDVMKAYNKIHGNHPLDRDDYLYRVAKLQAYRMEPPVGSHVYVLMPRPDGQPVFLDEANYNRLAEAAWLYPIAEGRRMTDADVFNLTWQNTDNPTLAFDALKAKATAKLKEAAENQMIAEMFGQKTVSKDDRKLWDDFRNAMTRALPALCVLDIKRQKALFSSFRNPAEREQVLEQLQRYGASLRAVDEDRKKREKAQAKN